MKDATIVYGIKLLTSLEFEERHKVICLDKFNDLKPKKLKSIFSQKCFQKCSFIIFIQIELPINTTSNDGYKYTKRQENQRTNKPKSHTIKLLKH